MKLKYLIANICFNYVLCFNLIAHAQKPALGIDDLNKWKNPIRPILSANGKFIAIVDEPEADGKTFSVKLMDTENQWHKSFIAATKNINFSADNRYFVSMIAGDTLSVLDIQKKSFRYVPKVSSFELSGNHLLIKAKNGNSFLYSFLTGAKDALGIIGGTVYAKSNNSLMIRYTTSRGDSIVLISTGQTKRRTIADNVSRVMPFGIGKGVLFEINKDGLPVFKLYDATTSSVSEINGLPKEGFSIQAGGTLGHDERYLQLNLLPEIKAGQSPSLIGLDIWSYRDTVLQSAQLLQIMDGGRKTGAKPLGKQTAIVDLSQSKIIFIGNENEDIIEAREQSVIIRKSILGNSNEYLWNLGAKARLFVVDTRTGKRTALKKEMTYASFSPNGQFILYYSEADNNYFSYEVATGKIRNISGKAGVSWYDPFDDHPEARSLFDEGKILWLSDNRYVVVSDYYDLWKVDLLGLEVPVNTTKGYGRKHNISFYHLLRPDGEVVDRPSIVLAAFNRDTKENGFFKLGLGRKPSFEKLSMGPYMYFTENRFTNNGERPTRATDAEIYTVLRQSSTEHPNYFLTRDFKKFNQLTFKEPQKKFNWLSAELVSVKQVKGDSLKGVLYRPENWDPKKKYPVILYYYEIISNNLNSFPRADYSVGELNIAYFVSNGYLVFTPDIKYTIGEPGKSALAAVNAAADFLSTLSYVDTSRMGIQGHSFGGYQTNYIVANSQRFSASSSSAGFANFVSMYNTIDVNGKTNQGTFFEVGQNRMGSTLWQNPQGYIDQSPIFRADKISTPLLIMHNMEDKGPQFSQAAELFTSLRRLGKISWLLQYDKQGHVLFTTETRRDFTIRMKQFFDHYLKGLPAPNWMLDGIPAKMKGIDDGLELDTTGRTPGPGLLKTK